jgi:hypothetical protein
MDRLDNQSEVMTKHIIIYLMYHRWLAIVSQICASMSETYVWQYIRAQGYKTLVIYTLAGIILWLECLVNLVVVLKNTLGFGKGIGPVSHTVYVEVNLVTALVPSDTACLASSPGRARRTAV